MLVLHAPGGHVQLGETSEPSLAPSTAWFAEFRILARSTSSARAPSMTRECRSSANQSRRFVANLFRAKLIGRTMEVLAEVLNTVQVGADGCIGEVAATQLIKHELT